MTKQVFGKEYADQYDSLYGDKDYEAECDLLEEIFRRYVGSPVHTILDLGCGTGNHAILLAQHSYKVTGVDRSSEMIAHAQNKSQSQFSASRSQPVFIEGDLRSLDLNQTFDAVIMMFAVLGYQLTNDDVLAALRTVRRHLRSGGLFICDVWYGPAVLTIRPGDRVKVIPNSDGKIIRTASGSLDIYHQIANVHYHTWTIKEQKVVSEAEETHKMRYFFPQELALFMVQAQMELSALHVFGDLDSVPTVDSWNISLVSKAR